METLPSINWSPDPGDGSADDRRVDLVTKLNLLPDSELRRCRMVNLGLPVNGTAVVTLATTIPSSSSAASREHVGHLRGDAEAVSIQQHRRQIVRLRLRSAERLLNQRQLLLAAIFGLFSTNAAPHPISDAQRIAIALPLIEAARVPGRC